MQFLATNNTSFWQQGLQVNHSHQPYWQLLFAVEPICHAQRMIQSKCHWVGVKCRSCSQHLCGSWNETVKLQKSLSHSQAIWGSGNLWDYKSQGLWFCWKVDEHSQSCVLGQNFGWSIMVAKTPLFSIHLHLRHSLLSSYPSFPVIIISFHLIFINGCLFICIHTLSANNGN